MEEATLRDKFDLYKSMGIHQAVQSLNIDAVRTLISFNEDLIESREERTQDTPLHVAASVGSYEIVMCLLGWGAEANVVNKRGRTPVMSAIRQVHGEVCSSFPLSLSSLSPSSSFFLILLIASLVFQ